MNAFDLLKDPIKQYIWRLGWRKFFPIQEAAVQHVLTTKDNYILASRTASGKTEAAFLPAINAVDGWHDGVKILYISPLIALINDQFLRIEKLCEHLDIKITRWHGEASKASKDHLIKNPEGILLITPESIEAMFDNHPENIRNLFVNLEFVIIDEIHSFLGTSRGKHLQSLLSRVKQASNKDTRYIGLSATLARESYELAKSFFDSDSETKVLVDGERNELTASLFYYPTEAALLPPELIEDIYEKTQTRKALIFPNTRGRVEEIAVRLKKLAEKKNGHDNYFAHHSSIDRDLREFVEHFAKSSYTQNFAISCTSTLELGIDIGSVDTVIQVDSTFSIASLVQRLGRSGRQDHRSNLILYATNPWSLLQAIACIELYKEKFIEPLPILLPLDVLVQQVLSYIKASSGLLKSKLINQLHSNKVFANVTVEVMDKAITHLIQTGVVELAGSELIIGTEGEKIVNKKDFYSLFDAEDNLKVDFKGRVIGELPLSPQLVAGENIFLGAKIWKIQEVNLETKKVFVLPAKDGKKPKFFGTGGDVHPRVRSTMLEVLIGEKVFSYLDQNSQLALKELQKHFQSKGLTDLRIERPVFVKESKQIFYTFSGSRINKTLFLYFNILGHSDIRYIESESAFETETSFKDLFGKLKSEHPTREQVKKFLTEDLQSNLNKYKLGKFAFLLPTELQADYLIENTYDIATANEFIQELKIV